LRERRYRTGITALHFLCKGLFTRPISERDFEIS
jgi:hypothetical protein